MDVGQIATEDQLTDCDREPIHIPGSIQPHGALLALDPETLEVLQVAGDLRGLLGCEAADLLGRPLNARLVSFASKRCSPPTW